MAAGLRRHGLERGDRWRCCSQPHRVRRRLLRRPPAGMVALPLNTATPRTRWPTSCPGPAPGCWWPTSRARRPPPRPRPSSRPPCSWSAIPSTSRSSERSPRRRPKLDVEEFDPESLAVLLFTSGTSGPSRGAMLSHRALLANIEQLLEVDPLPMQPDDVVLVVLPLFHVYALNAVLACRRDGRPQRARPQVLAGRDPRPRRRARVTNIPAAPRSSSRGPTSRTSTTGWPAYARSSRVRHPSPLGVQRVRRPRGPTGVGGLRPDRGGARRVLHHGRSAPQARLRRRAAPGVEIGWSTSPARSPTRTTRARSRSAAPTCSPATGPTRGRTGRRRLVRDGRRRLPGRGRRPPPRRPARDLILVSGFNVYPFEIETVIASHPDVAEVAVIGVPHDHTGESVKAYVTPLAGAPSRASRSPRSASRGSRASSARR